jgi:hypothetical protein
MIQTGFVVNIQDGIYSYVIHILYEQSEDIHSFDFMTYILLIIRK